MPITDATIANNQAQAAKLGVTIPGVGYRPPPTPSGTTFTVNGNTTTTVPGGVSSPTGNDVYGNPVATPRTDTTGTDKGTTNTDTGSPELSDQADRRALAQTQADYQTQSAQVQNTISNIQNGVIPLTPGEQAQVDGLKAQFQTLVDAQTQVNTQAAGVGQIRGYQKGAAEYDPSFQVKTIGAIVSAGAAKIADLQVKEASAVAALTQSFHEADIAAVKDAWNMYQDASKARQDALSKTIDDTQKAIKDATDARLAAEKVTYEREIKPKEDLATEAAKFNAPPDVLAAINNAPSVAEALKAGAGYFQDPTSLGGQYASYVKAATAAGQTPISVDAFIAKQKYREAYATASGTAAGKLSGEGSGSGSSLVTASLPSSISNALAANGFTKYNTTTQDLAQQLVEGLLAPAELSKRSTGTSSYSDILTAANKYSMATTGEKFDIAKADIKYKYSQNVQTQNTLKFLKSLVGKEDPTTGDGNNLQKLIALSDQRVPQQFSGLLGIYENPDVENKESWPALNQTQQWLKLQTGDPQIAAYYGTLLEVSDQVAKILQGGGTGNGTSDAKLRQASDLFQKGFNPDQVRSVATALQGLLGNRAKAMVSGNPYLNDYADTFDIPREGAIDPNQQIIQAESVAEGKLSKFYTASDNNKALIDSIHKQFPDMSAQEVMQKLGI